MTGISTNSWDGWNVWAVVGVPQEPSPSQRWSSAARSRLLDEVNVGLGVIDIEGSQVQMTLTMASPDS